MSTQTRQVDYFLAPNSPWTYLGHARFAALARATGATVRVRPVDLGQVFPVSGGLPLAKRAPQRQAYRLVEMQRFAQHLGLPMNLKPAFFPVAADDAARLIIAVDMHDGTQAAMALTGAILASVWVHERNIADPAVLAGLLQSQGLPGERLQQAGEPAVQQRYEADTREAIDLGVFGAPTYRVDNELFWGQDRLDFVERKLRSTT